MNVNFFTFNLIKKSMRRLLYHPCCHYRCCQRYYIFSNVYINIFFNITIESFIGDYIMFHIYHKNLLDENHFCDGTRTFLRDYITGNCFSLYYIG